MIDLVIAGKVTPDELQTAAAQLARAARRHGMVLTVSQRAEPPLAMGRHTDVVEVRPARVDGGYQELRP
ncbi:MAG: hypothetical protein ACTHK2_03860 [Dokdonella sp.]|uniref:hypothetical protein n=1 Tax=Dokdonella sp. TaxID=2291710 RepID=UPI003F80D3B0